MSVKVIQENWTSATKVHRNKVIWHGVPITAVSRMSGGALTPALVHCSWRWMRFGIAAFPVQSWSMWRARLEDTAAPWQTRVRSLLSGRSNLLLLPDIVSPGTGKPGHHPQPASAARPPAMPARC